jgi:hypothetical protein
MALMKNQEDIDSWYEEEKKKAMEKFQSLLEKKVPVPAAEKRYIRDLNAIFARYKKMNVELIDRNLNIAKAKATQKIRKKWNPLGFVAGFKR